MKNFKTHKLRRVAAFLMSMVLSFTTLASDASLLSAYAATPTANVKSSVTNTTGKADVSVTKSATVDGKGNVTITFDVENKSTTQTVVTSTATEVVFVMDLSGSMQDNSKESNARAAAKQFVAKLLDTSENGLNKDHNIKVGFVGFNDGATGYALTDSLTQANANIDKLKAEDDTGTNIQAGIHTARSLFSNTDCKKIMIVLSDGQATYSYKPTHMSNTQITLPDGSVTSWIDTFDYGTTKGDGIGYNYYGWTYLYSPSHRALQIQYKWHLLSSDEWYVTLNGLKMEEYYNAAGQYVDVPHSRNSYIEVYGDALDDHGLPAISEAQLAKNSGIEIFSISYGVAADEQSNASYVLKNVASTADKYKTSNAAAANLNAVVGAITKEVEHSIELARGTKIVDQLPSYITIIDASAQSKENGKTTDAPLFTAGASSIEWSLGEAKKATLTISAKVDIAAAVAANGLTMEDFKNGKEIKLNDSVTITYKDKDGNNKTDTSISGANVPAGIIKTYPYSISYTLDGVAVASLPTVSNYAFEGQSIQIPIPVGNYKTPVVKRGNTAISASEDGNYYFAAGTSNNNIVVALKTATHTVTFYGGADGKTFISKATVEHGASAAEFEPTADKIPAVEGKHFTGWDTTFTEIVDDLDVHAKYETNTYSVSFEIYVDGVKNEEASKSYTEVAHGTSVDVPSFTPTYNPDEFTYTSSGWLLNNEVVTLGSTLNATQNATYVLNWTSDHRKYDVKYIFIAADGTQTELTAEKKSIYYGEAAGAAPDASKYEDLKSTAENAAQTGFNYSDWFTVGADGKDVAYSADMVVYNSVNVYVRETSYIKSYDITFRFVPAEGTATERTVSYEYGTTPVWPTELVALKQPAHTDQYDYTYVQQTPAEVAGAATYTITEGRTLNSYNVVLTVIDNGVSKTLLNETYDYGKELDFTEINAYEPDGIEGYTAETPIAWTWGDSLTVTGPYTASTTIQYGINVYDVSFVFNKYDEKGELLASVPYGTIQVEHGSTIGENYPGIADSDKDVSGAQYTYTVDPDWSVAADTAITGTTTVTLSQRRTVNNYDITFVFVPVEGDTITRTVSYPYGATPQWHADVIGAEKADTAQYDYSYAEDAFAEVTGLATYTITESRKLQHYTVTFTDHEYNNGEGQDKGRTYTFEGDYGDEITMPDITKKGDDERYHYTLVMNPETGWNPGKTYEITGPASFEASYTGVYIEYKITFKVKAAFDNYEDTLTYKVVDFDHNVVNTADVVTDKTYTQKYVSDGEYTYTLTDFADSYTVTNVNTVVYAEWTKDATWHTITYLVNGEAAAPQQVQFGKAFEASTAAKKDGYHFTGWSWYVADKAEDGTVTKGEALDEKPATMPSYDLVAEANYAKNEYIVEFKGLNDKALKEPFTITDGDTVTYDGIPEEEGYHFLGWDKSFGPIVNLDHEAHYVITAVYGQEKSISMADVTVTYDGKDHSIIATSSTIPAKDIAYSIKRNDESHVVQSNVATVAGVYTVTATGTYSYTITDGVTVKEFKSTKEATLTINRKSVTVTPERVEITYGDAAVALTAGVSGLVDGESKDLITYTLTREDADNTNAGTYKITASGNEIQGNYKVTFGTADYVIKPIDASSVLITAGSANKTYDGKPLVSEDYTYTGTLMEGDVLVATTKGSVTNVGTADNVISSFKVMRGDVDVTRNYTGIGTANGKLEVTKRDITVQVDHAEKVYDGTPLTENGVTLIDETSLAEGETITATTLGTITDAGEVTNEIDTVTIMHGDEDVTANYNITKVNNTLTISKRVVTITAEDATKYQNEPDPTFRGRVENAVEAAPIEVYYYRWNAADNIPGDKEIFISVHGTYPNYDIRQINGTFTILAVGGENPPQDNPPQNPPQENPPVQNPPAENPPAENPPAETQNTEPQETAAPEANITEPETAKAAGPAGDEMIPEEETPLASLPNEYYALWLLLILILGYAIYWGFRTYDNNKNLKGNE